MITSLLLALSLAVDACVVSIALGIQNKKRMETFWHFAIGIPLCFGFFQAAMPFVGWQVASVLSNYISVVDTWIAFFLLIGVGANMIRNSFRDEDDHPDTSFKMNVIFSLAVATSIDALAVGFTLPTITSSPLLSIGTIGVITTLLCFFAFIGTSYIPERIANSSERIAGIVLICLAVKMLLP